MAAVLVGGFVGTVARFLVSRRFNRNGRIPAGTLLVNVLGSFVLGAISPHVIPITAKDLILVGLLGGFTTFSSMAFETTDLFGQGLPWRAAANLGLNIALGLAAALLGVGVSSL